MCSVTFDWGENDAMEKVKHFEKTLRGMYGRLLWATVEFTELCNHRCVYCYENAEPKLKYNIMDKETALKLIDYLSRSGIRQLTCSGGEPLMYPYIKDVIKAAKDKGLVVHMITNGYFLTKELAKELFDLGLTQVQINIDSVNPKKHDTIRGKKGSFEHAVNALKNAREAGMTTVTQTVVTELNEDEIVDIFKLARSIGVNRCRVWDIVPSEGRALEHMHLKPTRNYIDILKELTEYAKKTGATNIESGDPLFPQDYDTGLSLTGGYCPYSIGLLANISVRGDSYFCCTNRENSMYNIFDVMNKNESLGKVHAERLRKTLKRLQFFNVQKECLSCNFFKKCMGGCYMRRRYVDHEKDYWCERDVKKNTEQEAFSQTLLETLK